MAVACGLDRHVGVVGSSGTNEAQPGPTISGCLDFRQSRTLGDGFLVQDGTFPLILTTFFRLVQGLLPSYPPANPKQSPGIRSRAYNIVHSSMQLDRNQVYLTVGHDDSVGSVALVNDQPYLDMRGVEDRTQASKVRDLLAAMTHALGGVYKAALFKLTVHLLGGMNMASDGTGRTGCTSHAGEVFTGSGSEVHPGLVVVDGSVVPRSLGSNPLATITALAERSVRLAAESMQKHIDYDTFRDFEHLQRQQNPFRPPQLNFSETMTGNAIIGGTSASIALTMDVEVQQSGETFW
ncbi:hypothetical protein LTR86_004207 [Recurvomyces mirabilis]|nr:hypothetical protein LTR86_004207 [Recurvomyces mirabilis]